MFQKSLVGILFLSILVMAGCEKEAILENPTLTRYSFEDFPVYHFQFAFTNASSQPITIHAIEVYNEKGTKLEHSERFHNFLADAQFRIELLTHDTSLEGYEENPFDLKKSPFPFSKGTPLERAILIYNKDYVEGKMAINDPDKDRKITVEPVARVMRGKESINPARYLLFTEGTYDALQLKITYKMAENLKTVEAKFEVQEKPLL